MAFSSLQHIYTGGLHCLDDPTISGGQSIKLFDESYNVVIGDKTKYQILDMNLDWDAILKNYWHDFDEFVKPSDTSNFVGSICNMFNFPYIDNTSELLSLLKQLYNLDDQHHLRAFIKLYKIHESLSLTIKPLYTIWRNHLEKLIVDFNNMRTEYINKYESKYINKINHLDQLVGQWSKIDTEYNINSSSKILLYFNPPATPGELPWISKSDKTWIIPKFYIRIGDIKDKLLYDAIQDFENQLNQFTYLGFCPCRPIFRLVELFKFPIKELIICLELLGNIPANYCHLYKHIENISTKIKKPKLNIEPIGRSIYIKNDASLSDQNNILKEIRWYVEELLKLHMKLKKYILKYEKYYVNVAKIFNKIEKQFAKYLTNH